MRRILIYEEQFQGHYRQYISYILDNFSDEYGDLKVELVLNDKLQKDQKFCQKLQRPGFSVEWIKIKNPTFFFCLK